jgi:hypothetical protein
MTDCPSDHHEEPVPGTVHGMFRNRYNHEHDGPCTYCARCAATAQMLGFFTPSTEDPEGLALVQTIHQRKAKEPAMCRCAECGHHHHIKDGPTVPCQGVTYDDEGGISRCTCHHTTDKEAA